MQALKSIRRWKQADWFHYYFEKDDSEDQCVRLKGGRYKFKTRYGTPLESVSALMMTYRRAAGPFLGLNVAPRPLARHDYLHHIFLAIYVSVSTSANFRRKNIRLRAGNYRGQRLYFVTLCFHNRRRLGTNPHIAHWVIGRLQKHAAACEFFIHAYCVMPRPRARAYSCLHGYKQFDQIRRSVQTGNGD